MADSAHSMNGRTGHSPQTTIAAASRLPHPNQFGAEMETTNRAPRVLGKAGGCARGIRKSGRLEEGRGEPKNKKDPGPESAGCMESHRLILPMARNRLPFCFDRHQCPTRVFRRAACLGRVRKQGLGVPAPHPARRPCGSLRRFVPDLGVDHEHVGPHRHGGDSPVD